MAKKAAARKTRTPKVKAAVANGQQAESELARASRAHEETGDDTRAPAPSRQESRARTSREQELRDAEDFYAGEDFDLENLERPNLSAPAALPGMVQRWVASVVMGEKVPHHETKQWNKGWRPRSPDTVKGGQAFPSSVDQDGKGYIGNAGLVLMHRPIAVARKARDLNRKKIATQHASAEGNLRADEVEGHEFMIDHKTQVTTRPVVAEEEEY